MQKSDQGPQFIQSRPVFQVSVAETTRNNCEEAVLIRNAYIGSYENDCEEAILIRTPYTKLVSHDRRTSAQGESQTKLPGSQTEEKHDDISFGYQDEQNEQKTGRHANLPSITKNEKLRKQDSSDSLGQAEPPYPSRNVAITSTTQTVTTKWTHSQVVVTGPYHRFL